MQTTLYDLIQTLQDIMGPEGDVQVVAIVVKMMQSGRIRAGGPT